MQINCADCGCTPEECRHSVSPKGALIVHGLNAVVGMPLMASEKDNHLLDSPEEYL